ncbi:hypothetical protein DM01DRAFT_1335702 [Hesseltinella vesiculosa]|uniref:Uncharacterized protein n=1 Tax=Hesseltinella vesiculosa TaxID=101127 RepID=A0A1X2GII9_9FUNG|nr:hypothetical protein DM01DRAFT_1335702 [Hesseltinella vesiculosa]
MARTFYCSLYSQDHIDPNSVSLLLDAIPSSARASPRIQSAMTAPISFVDLLEASKRCPRRSSPGLDGLPYQILH